MRCPHCNTENEKNAIFCTKCNAWILGEVYEEETPAAPKAPANAAAKQEKKQKRTAFAISAALAVLLLGIAVLLWPKAPLPPATSGPLLGNTVPGTTTQPPTTNPPLTSMHEETLPPIMPPPMTSVPVETLPPVNVTRLPNYTVSQGAIAPKVVDWNLLFIVNDQAISTSIPSYYYELSKQCRNLSGTAAACLTKSSDLAYINGTTPKLIASQVIDYRLSADGTSLFYKTNDASMNLYRFDEDTYYRIPNARALKFCISPNGDHAAYLSYYPEESDNPYELNLFDGVETKSFHLFDKMVTLLGISNDGKTVYVLDMKNQLMSISDTGNITELGSYTSKDGSMLTLEKHLPVLSSDHRQILYYTSEGTFLSIDGQPGEKLSSRFLTPVAPDGTETMITDDMITFPGDSLLGAVYSANSHSNLLASNPTTRLKDLLYVSGSDDVTVLANDVSEYQVLAGGTSLYFLNTFKQLYALDLLNLTMQEVSTNAETFLVSRDGKYLYYIMDEKLLRVNTEDFTLGDYLGKYTTGSKLYITEDNALCVWSNTHLFVFHPDNASPLLYMDVTGCEFHNCGTLYVTTTDGIYILEDNDLTKVVDLQIIYDMPEIDPVPPEEG